MISLIAAWVAFFAGCYESSKGNRKFAALLYMASVAAASVTVLMVRLPA